MVDKKSDKIEDLIRIKKSLEEQVENTVNQGRWHEERSIRTS